MGVLTRKCTKTLLFTETQMGRYALGLFHLLWRLSARTMIDDDYRVSVGRGKAAGLLPTLVPLEFASVPVATARADGTGAR